MKRSIGKAVALYPMPLTVVGAMVEGKPNWLLAGHVGILGHDRVLVSLARNHYTNRGIRETRALSLQLVDEAMLERADRAGCVSGALDTVSGKLALVEQAKAAGTPIICAMGAGNKADPTAFRVADIYETEGFDNFICTIENTCAQEEALTPEGRIDYRKVKPVLFEMPTYEYLRTGDVLAKCRSLGGRT